MWKRYLIVNLLILTSLLPLQTTLAADVDPEFNPNHIIDDSEMLNATSMSLTEIQQFLEKKGSYLATYSATAAYGNTKTAAQMIYDAARNNYDCTGVSLGDNPTEADRAAKCQHITTINPKFIITLLQKESSLIETAAPAQARLDWATGYGCPDGNACNPYYKGLGKQINSAALQFLAYMNEQSRYPYKAGQTYTFNNPYNAYCSDEITTVTPDNKATAALYNYTPHVYNGNYNFFRLYKKYFPIGFKNYPDGTLVQIEGEAGIWLLQGGQKRPFLSYSALISRFDPKKVVIANASALESYPKGAPIKFPNYSLLRSPEKNIYLIVNDEKRLIAGKDTFKKIGFSIDEVMDATVDDLENYKLGQNITATSTYPTGKLMQDPKSGGVFYVESGYKYPVIDKVLLTTKFKGKKITKGTTIELNKYTKGAPVLFDDGELLSSPSSPTVYLISEGRKRPFSTGQVFETLGYKFSNVISVSPQLLANYPTGDSIIIKEATN
jgi:hypothetical protein